MRRLSLLLLAVSLGSCAHGRSCPVVDEERLARAIASELMTRSERAHAEPDDAAGGSDEVAALDPNRYRIDVTGHPVRGPADARVTLVAFSDFECPFCERATATLDALVERHGDALRIVWFHRPLPFHEHAEEAAEAANEAFVQGGDAAFDRMARGLFATQRALGREAILRVGAEVGLDVPRLSRALETRAHRPTIDADQAVAARVGALGTPTFFVNGRRLEGAQPLEIFDRLVTDERAIADALVASGIAPAEVYATLMRDAVERFVAPPSDSPDPVDVVAFDPDLVYRVPVGTSPRRGPDDALVTIVEFADFECPFCNRASATLDALVERFGADLRIVFKHRPLPFHAYARYAAATALEARDQLGDRAFFAVAHRFASLPRGVDDESIDAVAADVGLDMARLSASRADGRHDAEIAADEALADRLGVLGTPTFFVNGRVLEGAQPLETFVALVTTTMADARARVADGTPRAQVYARILEGTAADPRESRGAVTLPEESDAIAEGPRDAAVVVQIATDLTSADAARIEHDLLGLRTRFGGRVRFVYRDRPSARNPVSRRAAEVGRAVFAERGIAGYLAYRRAIVARGPSATEAEVERLAVSAGRASRARLRRALAEESLGARVDADETALSRALPDASVTTLVLVGTTSFVELRSHETYEGAIASALGE